MSPHCTEGSSGLLEATQVGSLVPTRSEGGGLGVPLRFSSSGFILGKKQKWRQSRHSSLGPLVPEGLGEGVVGQNQSLWPKLSRAPWPSSDLTPLPQPSQQKSSVPPGHHGDACSASLQGSRPRSLLSWSLQPDPAGDGAVTVLPWIRDPRVRAHHNLSATSAGLLLFGSRRQLWEVTEGSLMLE